MILYDNFFYQLHYKPNFFYFFFFWIIILFSIILLAIHLFLWHHCCILINIIHFYFIFLIFFLHCILKSTLTLTTKIYKFLIIFIEFYPFIFIKWTTSYLNSEIFHHLSEWILFNNLIANEIINFFFFTSISTSTLHHLQIFSYFLSMISLIKCFK